MKLGVPWMLAGAKPDALESAREEDRRAGPAQTRRLNDAGPQADKAPLPPALPIEANDSPPVARARTVFAGGSRATSRRGDKSSPLALVSEFDERFRELMLESRVAADEINRRLSIFDQAFSAVRDSRETTEPARSPLPALDAALAEISRRQRELDGDPQPNGSAESARHEEAPPSPGHLASLEPLLAEIMAQVSAIQPTAFEASLKALRADIADIACRLADAAPRRAVEALQADVRLISRRLEEDRRAGSESPMLADIEHGVAELREHLRAITPAENVGGLDALVRQLSDKVDGLLAGRSDARAPDLSQLESEIAGLRISLSNVASAEMLAELSEHVRTLAARLDAIEPGSDNPILKRLDERIAALADALEARRREDAQSWAPTMDELVRGFSERLEALQSPPTEQPAAVRQLDERMAQLVDKLEGSESRLGHLEAIESGMAELLLQLDAFRAEKTAAGLADGAGGAPSEAIRRDIAELRDAQLAAERRTQESLEVVHGTIGVMVDRLAAIESELQNEGRAKPPAPHDSKPTADCAAGQHVSAAPPRPGSAWTSGTTELASPASARPKPTGKKPSPIDPTLPPDHPLEPGSVPAHVRSRDPGPTGGGGSANQAGAAGQPEPAASTKSFIAAARRAAKAAVVEQNQQASQRRTSAGPIAALGSASSRMGRVFGDRAKSLLIGASVVVIVLGVVRVVLTYFDGDEPKPTEMSRAIGTPPRVENSPTDAAAAPSLLPASPAPGARIIPVEPTPVAADRPGPGDRSGAAPLPTPQLERPPQGTAPGPQPPPTPDVTGSLLNGQPMLLSEPAATRPAPAIGQQAARPPGHPLSANLPATIGGPALRNAASAGDPAAAYEVAVRFAEGRGVQVNLEEAARWFERAAQHGLAPAQFRLGSLYEKGLGVKKDLAQASRLYLAAADKGNAKAMHNLAVLYAEGIDGKPDFKSAIAWFRKAADRDVPDSQYNLGVLFARGIGAEQNLVESYKWFSLAARKGDNDAAKKRDDIAARLDASSLATARLAVQNWTVEPQPDEAHVVKAPAAGWDPPAPRATPGRARPKA